MTPGFIDIQMHLLNKGRSGLSKINLFYIAPHSHLKMTYALGQ